MAHERKGIADDWRTQFTDRVETEFNARIRGPDRGHRLRAGSRLVTRTQGATPIVRRSWVLKRLEAALNRTAGERASSSQSKQARLE